MALDPFPQLALQKAKSTSARRLFRELTQRAVCFEKMHLEFGKKLVQNREQGSKKSGDQSENAKSQLQWIEANNILQSIDLQDLVKSMNDQELVGFALANAKSHFDADRMLFRYWHKDDKPAAGALMNFNKETINLIESFLLASSGPNK